MNNQPGGSTFAARAALLGLGAAALLNLAACNVPGAAAAGAAGAQPSSAAPAAPHRAIAVTAPVSSAPVSSAPVSSTPAFARPVTHHYRDARNQWLEGATASSAMEGNYWLAAAADLKAAGTPAYATAITELRQLTALPDAEQTPAQNAEFHHDINALNTFFGTPGQYS
jgi:hypothetical protein